MIRSARPQPHADGVPVEHMIVCGDDGLAHRLADELRDVYQESVTLVVPEPRSVGGLGPDPSGTRRSARLLGRFGAAVTRSASDPRVVVGPAAPPDGDAVPDTIGRGLVPPVRELTAADPSEAVLHEAGVDAAAALALVYEDDETNIRAALAARRLNPGLRLVVRLYNRKLGQHLEELLDQAALVARPGMDPASLDASTTVLSDADTTAPSLAATAVTGTGKVVRADGLLLRAVERPPAGDGGPPADRGIATLALLSSTTTDPAGEEGSDRSGGRAPDLLPDEETVHASQGRGTVVLETVTRQDPVRPPRRRAGRWAPLSAFFSARLRWALAGVLTAVVVLTLVAWALDDEPLVHAVYLTLLDLIAIGDPAHGEDVTRQLLQLLTSLVGLALLPLLVAGVLEALGTFRGANATLRPLRGLSGHVVLLGLGKIGTRVLASLRELGIPVVCIEEDPEARGIPLARSLRVPVVMGDVTQEGVLETAKVHRARALLALTSEDTTNLEAALYARSVKPDLRVALRLYDDDFATAVYRTLRAAHPEALTRSRSVSHLAAPAFAGAMMGRQILGAIPVERRVLLFAAVPVAGNPQFEGRTVGEAFRPGVWRVLALDTADPGARRPDLATARRAGDGPRLLWDLHPGQVLRPEDRVVIAATRRGVAELLGRRTRTRTHL
ncbi:NAD-binding protein [Streptomyces sanyensis]|uniref:NAD-binding protein n=1 Tax=Streptomyces sanyensis TaxID=568869 RepID=UPI003D7799DA